MRSSQRHRLLALALATWAWFGCVSDGDDARAAEPIVRDSAGVRIVENGAPAWGADTLWELAEAPSVSIGVAEGDSMLLLSRVFSSTRLSSGEIVVADGGSSQLRWFDSTGRFVRAAGGPGEGPGEFTFLNRVWRLPGDTIAVTDITPRIAHFSADGRYIGAVTVEPPAGKARANVVGQAGDGHYLSMSGRGFGPDQAGRVITDSLRLMVTPRSGTGGREFAQVRAQERWGLRVGDRISFPFLPFSPPPSYRAGGDRLVTGDGRTPSIAVWNTDGTPRQIVRWRAESRPVTDELRTRYRDHRLEDSRDPNERRATETFLAESPMPDTLPVYQSVTVDATGTLWVEEFRPPWERQPVWQLFAPDGRWLGALRTPPRFTIFEIGTDHVLGRWLDEDNVEHVQLYPLRRTE